MSRSQEQPELAAFELRGARPSRGSMVSPTSIQGSMELKAAQADLQAEAHCPICKEDFENPVTECRHDFCHASISEFWKDPKGCFPCPLCHFDCPERKIWSQEQPSQAPEVAQPLPVQKRRNNSQQEEHSSEMQSQPPAPSSGKEQEVFSPSPTSRFVWPIEDAALCSMKQIEYFLKMWRETVEPAEKAIATHRIRSLVLNRMINLRREEVMSEYRQYRLFLQDQQKDILGQLENEKLAALAKLNENLEKFSDHLSSLKCLLSEAERNYGRSELELLASVKEIYRRHANLKCPKVLSVETKQYRSSFPPQFSGLDRIIKRFHVDVTLDPDTAHCTLDVSEDKKAVLRGKMKKLPNNQRRFLAHPVVLGSEGYSSGRHYWEVAVENMSEWLLGVCKEPFPRSVDGSKARRPFSVQDGLWGIGLTRCHDYIALGHKKIDLLPKVAPNRVGIFLDSDLHEVSFYNLHDKSLLCHFSDCASGALWPYFYTGSVSGPLKICKAEDFE
ncbi:tripartite motif-containing protein 60-like [Mesocricetus auratus]|uniref:Tripartite motif-containing protein 60-like n=1 Tax=Mesocricetus auratus TaxID=10036 RepID=A0A1U7QB76_MESAU|nr:tripartite motif-containing protein 60-like [Mesocricetus auratus]